ncbi:AMP-binding protein [Labilibaculum sp.]|uniref:AMP-binding protein n=1 Tax=Labilibaculum sp. TaxID=2060723 RepID=UPI003569382A
MKELTINGKRYSELDLIKHCRSELFICDFQWERDIYSFILEWLNKKDSISAKTSGSTGEPKRMRLSKQSMINSALLSGSYFKWKKGDNALLCLSPNFIAGKMMVVRAFVWQLNLILVEPNGHPMKMVKSKIDFVAMIPLQVINCLQEGVDFSLIDQLLIGGGVVDSHLESRLQEIPTLCFSSYGMTETVSHVAIKVLNGPARSKYFHSIGNVHFGVDDRDCLQITAPEILSEQLSTNDVVRLIDDQKFIWLGRYDHVVNSGGIKLFPEQIEEKLKPIISEAFFLSGIKDEVLGEKLILLIEKANPSEAYVVNLRKKMKGLLDKYEQAREILFIPDFQRTANGKVQRKATLSLCKLSK